MGGHPHANLMAEYAEDAKHIRQPWLRWAVRPGGSAKWMKMGEMPRWHTDSKYRRLVKSKVVDGNCIPLPIEEGVELPQGKYYVILLSEKGLHKQAYEYDGDVGSQTGITLHCARDNGALFTCVEDADTFINGINTLIGRNNEG